MPCYTHVTEEEKEEAARLRFRHNSDVAELLCAVMKTAPEPIQELLCIHVPKLREWWKEHQKRDAKKEG